MTIEQIKPVKGLPAIYGITIKAVPQIPINAAAIPIKGYRKIENALIKKNIKDIAAIKAFKSGLR